MRGNKFKVIMLVAILCVGIVSGFLFAQKPVKFGQVEAKDYASELCSQLYDDNGENVVFSAEHVYFAEDRKSELKYAPDGDTFTNILGSAGEANYFANYGGGKNNANKKIIKNGQYVKLDDTIGAIKQGYNNTGDPITIKQGIMLTLGGYVYDEDNKLLKSNSEKTDVLTYVNVLVYKDGEKIEGLTPRTFNSGINFDWVHFIEAKAENEGHYVISIEYMKGGKLATHSFDFYVLIESVYTKVSEIEGWNYHADPTIENVNKVAGKTNEYTSVINASKQPVISYDFKHYDFNYTYIVNDSRTDVRVEYRTNPEKLVVTRTQNNTTTTKEYACKYENDIVSFVFSNIGKYTFNFNYVHYERNVSTGELIRNEVPVSDLNIDSIILTVSGYEMNYAKTGYYSANFRKLSIVENGTLVIAENGFKNDEETRTDNSISLGYMFEIVAKNEKSGTIASIETTDVTEQVGSGKEIETTEDSGKIKFVSINSNIVNTDQGGAWLNLNDRYVSGGYYLYSQTAFGVNGEYEKKNLYKETTFTDTGYYFVMAKYKVDGGSDEVSQYFVFKLSSSMASIKMYIAEDSVPTVDDEAKRLYSNQFTNKDVYATWKEPTTFESVQIVTLYKAQLESECYQTKQALLNFANGMANLSLIKEDYQKRTLIERKGSYLLEVSIRGSQTRAYYYFTIDTDPIANVDLLGTSKAYLGDNEIYILKQDDLGKNVSYGNNLFVNTPFTIWWNDKASGAGVKATYTYTPIIAKASSVDKVEDGRNLYVYADYTFGITSGKITIEKPSNNISILNSDYVLTKAGIYWFEMEDDAGNKTSYMVIYDNTKAKFIAENEDGPILNGDVSNKDVNIEWGTHKALALGTETAGDIRTIISEIISGNYDENNKYFSGEKSNLSAIKESIKADRLLVKNSSAEIWMDSKICDVKINDGYRDLERVTINSGHNITLKVMPNEASYTVYVNGENKTSAEKSESYFKITLNSDNSEGAVYSSESASDAQYLDKVRVENDLLNYHRGQATDGNLLVFEWKSEIGSAYEVKEVYYQYYPLMTQAQLNSYDKSDMLYKYYPYEYSENATKNYIYNDDTNIAFCSAISRDGKQVYRSQVINSGYVLSYDSNGNLESRTATLPGMYVITRVYKNEIENNSGEKDTTVKSYVFFVDRNEIVDYSVTDNTKKTIGENIQWYLQEKLAFSNFSQDMEDVTINGDVYKIYLKTNRLPLEVLVPTGKYASVIEKAIKQTSNSVSGGLRIEILYQDSYGILGQGETLSFNLFSMEFPQKSGENYDRANWIKYLLTKQSLSDNEWVTRYLSACGKTGDQYLSLPGNYVIKIYDNVGKTPTEDSNYWMSDVHSFEIGFTIIEDHPSFDVMANQNPLDNKNVEYKDLENTIFTTSKAYVRYFLPKPDDESFYAQIDPSYISILQDGKAYNITSQTTFEYNGKNINYIQEVEDGYYIWLDTGLKIVDNKIVDYKEYEYTIYVRYELGDKNKYLNYYVHGGKQFYETKVNVVIDRTAYMENLNNVISKNEDYASQEQYLNSYFENYSTEGFKVSGKLDNKIFNTVGYRGIDGADNYAVVNQLYYYYVDKGDLENAKNAVYAIRVNENTKFSAFTSSEKNNTVYYRKLQLGENKMPMSLLPVCETYYGNSSNFYVFTESSSNFNRADAQLETWRFLTSNGYYEIVEKDEAGNLTQYVVLYIEDNKNVSSYNPSLTFTDLTQKDYSISFNFANYENEKLNLDGNIEIKYGGEQISTTGFTLNIFQTMEDMFGGSYDGTYTSSAYNDNTDYFYKLTFRAGVTGNQESIVKYLNLFNKDVAKIIGEGLSKNQDKNYYLTLENRFGTSLTLSFLNTKNPDQYKLNMDDFKAEQKAGEWYLYPDKLTGFYDIEGSTQKIEYYATKIELTDLTDGKTTTYSQASENWKEILLETGHAYYALITDLNQKTYTKHLYAYEHKSDDEIICYGNSEVVSNVHYTSNILDLKANNVIYNAQKIKIKLDGRVIYNDLAPLPKTAETKTNIEVLGTKYVEISLEGDYYISRFYPYNYNFEKANESGGLIEIEVALIYNSAELKTYSFVIDNRIGGLQFMANEEDKSDNLKIEYTYVSDKEPNKVLIYNPNNLFNIAPMSTLSDEIYLSWQDVLDVNYSNEYSQKYFNVELHLYEFASRSEMAEIDISKSNHIYIKPKVDILGRYVFVVKIVNLREQLVVYKAFAFNVSTTANAMYKVQDPEGNKVQYAGYVLGENLVGENGLFSFISISGRFGFTSLEDTNYVSFLNQKVPVYVSNVTLTVVRNGDNDYAIADMTLGASGYHLYLYKIYNKVYATYVAILQLDKTTNLAPIPKDVSYIFDSASDSVELAQMSSEIVTDYGTLTFPSYFKSTLDGTSEILAKINKMYLEVYYMTTSGSYTTKVGEFYGQQNATGTSSVKFSTSGRYKIYLRDMAGNIHVWGKSITGDDIDCLTLTILPEIILTINGEVPVDYAYYNDSITVSVAFKNYSDFYDNASVKMYAYKNGSEKNYITNEGGRKTEYVSEFTFTEYGTYRVRVEATRNGKPISKEIVFSIINPNESRMALDFTAISKYEIESVKNLTTNSDVSDIFSFLINEGYIYSKLITFERLTEQEAFGVNMGKQQFEVRYRVHDDELVPERVITFRFTINNETPTIQCSLTPGKSTTKNITLKFNPQAIFRQAGDCYIVVNDQKVMAINEATAEDKTESITLKDPAVYYVKIVTDSGRVLSSFKVTIKEPLNTWSIILIVAIVIVVIGVIVTFVMLRTKMKVR